MAKLIDYFIPKPSATNTPSNTQWVTINPNGGGDFLTINDAWNEGKKNMFLVKGVHPMTEAIVIDTSTESGREPLKFHGESMDDTFIQVNDGELLYGFDIITSDGYSNYYDYSVNPPVYVTSPIRNVTFLKGTNKMIANNFVWSDLNDNFVNAPVVGDYIEIGNESVWYEIREINNDKELIFDQWNSSKDFVEEVNFNKVNEVPIEMVNLTIGVGENPVNPLNSYGNNTIFYNNTRTERPKTGIKFFVKDVFGRLCYNDKIGNATLVHTGGGTPSFVQNIRLPGG